MRYLLLGLLILAINLIPVMAPPTWMIIVFYRLNSNLNVVALVIIAVIAAATGRFILGDTFHRLRGRLGDRYKNNLEVVRKALERKKQHRFAYLLLILLSPLPSAQLFEAAGLMELPLLPLVGVFAIGRSVSYSLYAFGASTVKDSNIGAILLETIKSPWAIALELISVYAIYLMIVKPPKWITSKF